MGDRDRRLPCGLGHGEPGQVTIDGRLELELPFVGQLKHRHRRERLADRTDLEEHVGGDRL
jgi:hypothetical protein